MSEADPPSPHEPADTKWSRDNLSLPSPAQIVESRANKIAVALIHYILGKPVKRQQITDTVL